MVTPGVDPQKLAQLQQFTSRIQARVVLRPQGFSVELSAPDAETSAFVGQIAQGLAAESAKFMYTYFGIKGELVKRKE